MRKIHENDIRIYILNEYNLEHDQVFGKIPKDFKHKILNNVFRHFTDYQLHFRDGLKNVKNRDLFDNYQSFNHLENYSQLAFDLNHTKQQSNDRLARAKRAIHRVKKERFDTRKRRKLRDIETKEYKLKWQPKNKQTKSRLDRLKKIREKEQDKNYER